MLLHNQINKCSFISKIQHDMVTMVRYLQLFFILSFNHAKYLGVYRIQVKFNHTEYKQLNMEVVSTQQVLKYINEARTNPRKFAQYIQKEIQTFIDNRTLPLVPGCNYSTNEGKGAWLECKQYLDSVKPLEPLKLSKALCLAAEDHAADMAAHNFMGHNGSDGSDISDRIYRRGEQVKVYNETIKMGQNIGGDFKYKGRDHALNTVKSLMIDDGVKNRGHRQNIMSKSFRYVGIGSRVVGDRIKVVMDFHTHDPVLKNSKAPSNTGTQLNYPQTQQSNSTGSNHNSHGNHGKFSNFGNFGGFDNFDNFDDFGNKGGFGNYGNHVQTTGGKGGSGKRYAVNTHKSTSTSTVNGKTTKKTIQTITYSDGTVEKNQKIQIH